MNVDEEKPTDANEISKVQVSSTDDRMSAWNGTNSNLEHDSKLPAGIPTGTETAENKLNAENVNNSIVATENSSSSQESNGNGVDSTSLTSNLPNDGSDTKKALATNEEISKKPNEDSSNKQPPADDPDALKLKFIFANRDGLHVVVNCKVTDSVGEVKGILMSMWPDSLKPCKEGDRLRLICMGKGLLMPDTKSLKDCEVPVFKTHATPINVSVRPEHIASTHKSSIGNSGSSSSNSQNEQRSCCVVL